MCEPITLATAGIVGAAGAGMPFIDTAFSHKAANKRQNALNDAIEAKYQADIDNARNTYYAQANQETLKAQQELATTQTNKREAQRQLRKDRAHQEAAMSALNVSGNTANKQLGGYDIMQTNLEGSYASEAEGIIANQQGANKAHEAIYRNKVNSAQASAKASWRPFEGNSWLKTGLVDAPLGFISGAVGGASSAAGMMGGLSGSGAGGSSSLTGLFSGGASYGKGYGMDSFLTGGV